MTCANKKRRGPPSTFSCTACNVLLVFLQRKTKAQNWLTGCIVPWKYWMHLFTGRRITCAHGSLAPIGAGAGTPIGVGGVGGDGNVYVQI